MKGKFIVIDGCDFTGKSTQIQKIASYLRNKNIKHITTREPGGTKFGEQIREIILESGKKLHPYTELLLFMSSRSEHIYGKIIPMLEQGISIICDRFLASSFVYQGVLHGVPSEVILSVHKTILNNFQPNLTFIMDMNPEIILQRMQAVAFKGCNAYDSTQLKEIAQIRNGFLEFTKIQECTIVDANQEQEKVFEVILRKINEMFSIN